MMHRSHSLTQRRGNRNLFAIKPGAVSSGFAGFHSRYKFLNLPHESPHDFPALIWSVMITIQDSVRHVIGYTPFCSVMIGRKITYGKIRTACDRISLTCSVEFILPHTHISLPSSSPLSSLFSLPQSPSPYFLIHSDSSAYFIRFLFDLFDPSVLSLFFLSPTLWNSADHHVEGE